MQPFNHFHDINHFIKLGIDRRHLNKQLTSMETGILLNSVKMRWKRMEKNSLDIKVYISVGCKHKLVY